jgi:mannose-6-phosphate isomerase-like protein (cupin superfamily)
MTVSSSTIRRTDSSNIPSQTCRTNYRIRRLRLSRLLLVQEARHPSPRIIWTLGSSMTPNAKDEDWPEALDALVAAPDHHTLLFENESVRILDTRIGPGARTAVHTHRWPAALYVISWSSFIRRDERGSVVLDSRTVAALRTPPQALWTPALAPHSLENIGPADLHIISVELKRAHRTDKLQENA